MSFQILVIVENYTEGVPHILLIGRDADGVVRTMKDSNASISISVAVGSDFNWLTDLANDLNSHLLESRIQCRQHGCKCGGDKFGFFREPCLKAPCRTAVASQMVVARYGFEYYEEDKRPFVTFEISRAFYANTAARFLKTANVGNVAREHQGLYMVLKNPVDSFMYRTGLHGMSWTGEDHGSAPFVSFYFDIETIAKSYNTFDMEEALHPVGCISIWLSTDHSMKTLMLEAPGIVDEARANTTFFADERNLLQAFQTLLLSSDPDFILGYNTNGFDIPYLMKRAKLLGLDRFQFLTRIPNQALVYYTVMKKDGAITYPVTRIDCPGRVSVDLLPVVKKDVTTLDSYKLKDVADYFELGAKGDVDYADLHPFFYGDSKSRAEIATYCERDVELCVQLEGRMDTLKRLMAKSKVLHIRPCDAADRGLGYQLTSLVRFYMKDEYMLPDSLKDAENNPMMRESVKMVQGGEKIWKQVAAGNKYEGGFVLEPEKGLHKCAVGTLDFAALYPSMAITQNISPNTLMRYPDERASPEGFSFIPVAIREGIYCKIWRSLKAQRKSVQREMAAEKDPIRKAMLHALQLELKLAMNALYGQLGALVSPLCNFPCAASTTAFGRYFIKRVLHALEANPEFKEKYDLKVIYGDTDSLMMALRKIFNRQEGIAAMKLIERWVNVDSGLLMGELQMNYENLSLPFHLVAKKNYVKCLLGYDGVSLVLKKSGLGTRTMTKFGREIQDDILKMGMIDSTPTEEIENVVKERFRKLLAGEIPREVLLHSAKLAKPAGEYDSDTPHVRATKQLLHENLEARPGDRIEYYFCNIQPSKKRLKCDTCVAAALIDSGGYTLDYTVYMEETLQSLTKTVVSFFSGNTPHEKTNTLHRLATQHPKLVHPLRQPPKYQTLPSFVQSAPAASKTPRSLTTTTTPAPKKQKTLDDTEFVPTEKKPTKKKVKLAVQTTTIKDYFK